VTCAVVPKPRRLRRLPPKARQGDSNPDHGHWAVRSNSPGPLAGQGDATRYGPARPAGSG
jgi:hypothetical protein